MQERELQAPPPMAVRPRCDDVFVLMIEDNAAYAHALERSLARAAGPSFRVEFAGHLASGIGRLADRRYDVIVLDLLLPDGEGLDALARIRGQAPGTPIVVLTGLADECLGIEALRRGAQDYLFKTQVDGRDIARALRYAIERARAERWLTIQSEVTMGLAEAATLAEAAPSILRAFGEGLGCDVGNCWAADPCAGVLRCVATWHGPSAGSTAFAAASRGLTFAPGVGLPGRVWALGMPVEIGNVVQDPRFSRAPEAGRSGLHGAIGFPIRLGEEVLAVLEFMSPEVRPPDDALLRSMATLGSQIGQFIGRQRALREFEMRKAAIFQTAPDAIVTMDHRGTIVEFNPAAERTFGYARAEAIGRPMGELLVPPSLRAAHRRGLARYLATGEPVLLDSWVETTAMRRDGSEFAADMAITRITTDGAPLFTGYIRDITGRAQSELELLRGAFLGAMAAKVGLALIQDDPLSTILGRCAEVLVRYLEVGLARIWTLDDDGEVLESRACRGMTDAVPDPGGRVPFDPRHFDPRDGSYRPEAPCGIADAASEWARREGFAVVTCNPLILGSRPVGLLELYANRPLQPAANDALGPVLDGIAQCVGRKRSEERLRTSETRLHYLIERMPGAIWSTDLELRFTSSAGTVNAALFAETDRSRRPMTLAQFFRTDDPDFPPIAAHRRALAGESVSYQLAWSDRLFQSHVEPLFDPQRRIIGCIGAAIDVTEHKRVEQALRRNQEEFRIAGEIQRVFYPTTAPEMSGFDIHGSSCPAQAAGGDYFDYMPMPGGLIGIAIGDVSGHGLGPALLMASTRAYLRALASTRTHAGRILTRLNQVLAGDVGDERYVTLIMVVLDAEAGTLTYANAGHPPGYILDCKGAIKAVLKSTGLPLGLYPDSEFGVGAVATLEPGDLALFLTDGITEAFDPDGTPFGVQRVLEVVRARQSEPARTIVEAIHHAVADFTRQEIQVDDTTAIVLKYGGDSPRR